MFNLYSARLVVRIAVLIGAILTYFRDKNSLVTSNFGPHLGHGPKPLDIIWMILAAEMISKFFPQKIISMGCRKQFKSNYAPREKKPDQQEIALWIDRENAAAKKVFAVWFGANAIVAGIYYAGFLSECELVLLTLLYAVCDLICVLIYCPFQSLIMKNRCCVTCRIFNWDSIMMCTPLFFIPSLFSWSLIIIALIVLIRWEYTYRRHPLRFLEVSNENLKCNHCKEQICKLKRSIDVGHTHSRPI